MIDKHRFHPTVEAEKSDYYTEYAPDSEDYLKRRRAALRKKGDIRGEIDLSELEKKVRMHRSAVEFIRGLVSRRRK